MGISAHDVTTTFRSSSTAATAATCRTGGRLKRQDPQRSGITHGAEMSYLNSTVMTFVSLPTALNNRKPLIAIVDDDEPVCRAVRRLVRSVAMDAETFNFRTTVSRSA